MSRIDCDTATPTRDVLKDYTCLLDVCRGDREAVAGLLQVFVRSVRDDLGAWEAACNDGDRTAERLSHKLRSGFHHVGEIGISRRLGEIEMLAKADTEGPLLATLCRQLLPQIDGALAKAELGTRNAHKQ